MLHNPPHPGEFIREICLEPLNLSVTQAAEYLGVTRKALSELLNGKSGISPEMALRLAKAFNTTPESWLAQQVHYDLWKARNKVKNLKVRPLWKRRVTKQNLSVSLIQDQL
jgi:addiction module HigA family antidote